MTDTTMMALTEGERAFIKALHTGDEAAMLSIFVEANGTRTLDTAEYVASESPLAALPPDQQAVLDAYHSGDILAYVKLMAAHHGLVSKAEQPAAPGGVDMSGATPAEKSAPAENPAPMPASTQARARTRARQIAPDIRFVMLSMLEELRDLVNDNACRIANERYGSFDKVGIFEEDAVADEIIVALADYFGIQPDLNQLGSQYHVNWFYDLEYDYSKKTYIAYGADGRTVVARDVLGEPDSWDPAQATGKADE